MDNNVFMEVCHRKATEILPLLAEILKIASTECNALRDSFDAFIWSNDVISLLSLTKVAENDEVVRNLLHVSESGAAVLLTIAQSAKSPHEILQGAHSILSAVFPKLMLPFVPKLDPIAVAACTGNILQHLNTVKSALESIPKLLTFFKEIFFNCRDANAFCRNEFIKVSTLLIQAISGLKDKTVINNSECNEDKLLLAFYSAVDKSFKMSLNALWLLFKFPELDLVYDVVFGACKLISRVLVTTLGNLLYCIEFFCQTACQFLKEKVLEVKKIIFEVQEASRHVLDAAPTETDSNSKCTSVETIRLSPPGCTPSPMALVTGDSYKSSSIDATTGDLSVQTDGSSHFVRDFREAPLIAPATSSHHEFVPLSSAPYDDHAPQLTSTDISDKSSVITSETLNVLESCFIEVPDSTVSDPTKGKLSPTDEDDIAVVHTSPNPEPEIFQRVNDFPFDVLPTFLRQRLLKLIWELKDYIGHFSFLKVGSLIQFICRICGSVLQLDSVEEHIHQAHKGIGKSPSVDPLDNIFKTNKSKRIKETDGSTKKSEFEVAQACPKKSICFSIEKKESKIVPVSISPQVFFSAKMNKKFPQPVKKNPNNKRSKFQKVSDKNLSTQASFVFKSPNSERVTEAESVSDTAVTSSDVFFDSSKQEPGRTQPKVCGIAESFYAETFEYNDSERKRRRRNCCESNLKEKVCDPKNESNYIIQDLNRPGIPETLNNSFVETLESASKPHPFQDISDAEFTSLTKTDQKSLEILVKRLKSTVSHLVFRIVNGELSVICKLCLDFLHKSKVEAHVSEVSHLQALCTKAKGCAETKALVPEISVHNWQYLEYIRHLQCFRCNICRTPLKGINSWVQHFQSILHRRKLESVPLPNTVEVWLASVTFLRDSLLKVSFSSLDMSHQDRIAYLIKELKSEMNIFSVEEARKLKFFCHACNLSVASCTMTSHIRNNMSHRKALRHMHRNSSRQTFCQSSVNQAVLDIISCIKKPKSRRKNSSQKCNTPGKGLSNLTHIQTTNALVHSYHSYSSESMVPELMIEAFPDHSSAVDSQIPGLLYKSFKEGC
ncbi:uncharacterized protein [Bemisia tabaci]|uniref:uncharacterized protein isoform X1 n=2 Tax=Bemisia tabaci TaxID=7038 RepID=UPI003B287CA7